MALESATSNGTTDENHPEKGDEWKKGWLLKKTHYTKRWKMMWFHIKEGQLVYGFNEKVRANNTGLRTSPRNSDQLISLNFSTPARARRILII